MNTDVSKVVASLDVANRAMKFRLSRGGTSKRIRDKSAEAQVASDTGDWNPRLAKALKSHEVAVPSLTYSTDPAEPS